MYFKLCKKKSAILKSAIIYLLKNQNLYYFFHVFVFLVIINLLTCFTALEALYLEQK